MARFTMEQAATALSENPHMPPEHSSYWQAIMDGTLPAYYQQEFAMKRYGYLDDIPPIDVRKLIGGDGVLTQYKCQTNYVAGLTMALRGAIADEVINNPALKEKISEFLKSDLAFKIGDPDNRERVARINHLLDDVLASFPS